MFRNFGGQLILNTTAWVLLPFFMYIDQSAIAFAKKQFGATSRLGCTKFVIGKSKYTVNLLK